MDLVVGTTGLSIVRNWSSILAPTSKVIVATLNLNTPYFMAPWLCLDSTILQRKYETKQALLCFGISDVSFLDYPSTSDFDAERLLAQSQITVGLYRIRYMYCDNSDITLFRTCKSVRGIRQLVSEVDTVSFTNKAKEKALLEFKEIL